MRLANATALLSLLPLLTFAPFACASDWSALLKDKALTDFSDKDIQQHLDAVHALLDAPLPAKREWSNPKTGAGARLEVIGQPSIAGFSECRRVRTSVYTAKRKAEARTWTACRASDGQWSLAKGS
jgi:surface antigen